MSELTVEVQSREHLGKNANRRLRASGKVPAVVYGDGKDAVAIEVPDRTIRELLKGSSGTNAVFLLKLAGTGKSRHAMIRDLQLNPMTGQMIHIDFQRIQMDQKIQVSVPIDVQGEAEGVKNENGLLDFMTRELEVECLPGAIPDQLAVDVSALHVGQHIEAGQIELPDGVTLIDEPDRVILTVVQGRLEEEEVEGEEEEDLIEAETSEPEVIGRSKDEDD